MTAMPEMTVMMVITVLAIVAGSADGMGPRTDG